MKAFKASGYRPVTLSLQENVPVAEAEGVSEFKAMETAIAVRELSKTYHAGQAAVQALREVDLDVRKSELLVLMGPSGSGKTTLLSIMGCVLCPTSGSVKIGGLEVTGLSEKKLPRVRLEHIGFIFQDFNLFPTLTAGENVELALDLKAIRGKVARNRAGEWLEQVGLSDKYDTFPSDLSGGQKQRVAIARALAGEPDILLADEPTAALDSQSGAVVIEMLRNLAHQHGRAVAIVTHDDRILRFADRIVQIEDGRISEESILERGYLASTGPVTPRPVLCPRKKLTAPTRNQTHVAE